MNLHHLLFTWFRKIGWLGQFLVALCVGAAFNFAAIFFEAMNAASRAGTHVVDGYEITVCYVGPPVSFYPRLLIFISLLVAVLGILGRSFPRCPIAVLGLFGALSTYVYWWLDSYRVFRNLTEAEIPIINNPSIKQVAYLYEGSWLDIAGAAAVVICLTLFVERLFDRKSLT